MPFEGISGTVGDRAFRDSFTKGEMAVQCSVNLDLSYPKVYKK